jgi:hypothetical protein
MARRFKRNAAHAARQGEQQTAAAAADLERVQQRQRNRAAKVVGDLLPAEFTDDPGQHYQLHQWLEIATIARLSDAER